MRRGVNQVRRGPSGLIAQTVADLLLGIDIRAGHEVTIVTLARQASISGPEDLKRRGMGQLGGWRFLNPLSHHGPASTSSEECSTPHHDQHGCWWV